jgi:hypothetical protein
LSLGQIDCTYFFHIGPLDYNRFDSFWNSSIDIRNILNYSIPWDIDYIQSGTTPLTIIKIVRVNTHQISLYYSNHHLKHRVE